MIQRYPFQFPIKLFADRIAFICLHHNDIVHPAEFD